MNRIAKIAIHHWKLLLAWNVLVLGITAINITITPKVWNSQAQLILPNITSDSDADLGKLGSVRDGGVVFSQQINPLNILSSIAMSDDVVNEVWQNDPEKDEFSRLSNFKKLFEVSPEKESTVISLSAEGSSPELARKRATALISAFRSRVQELRLDEAQQRSLFMQPEVKLAAQKLLKAQNILSEFKQKTNLVSSDEQTKEIISAINTLKTEQAQALAQAKAAEATVNTLSARVNLSPGAAVNSVRLKEYKEYQLVRDELSKVEVELVEALGKLTSNHPQVQNLQYQRAVLRNQLDRFIGAKSDPAAINKIMGENTANLAEKLIVAESEAVGMLEKVGQLQPQIDQLSASLNSLPQKQAKLLELQREYDIAEGVYNGVVAQAEQAKLGAFSAYPSTQILAKPLLNTKSVGPKLRLMILGALLASGFGSAAIALSLENRNPLLSPKDIVQTNIPVLASIPYIRNINVKSEQKLGGEIEFQRLASAVSLMQLNSGRLMIASATTSEGKTTTSLGLANALLNLGFKVLLVDGDFRRSELSQSLGYQLQQTKLDSRFVHNTIRPNLDLLSVKIAEDKISEFVARGEFEQHLNFVQTNNNYDYVLVDSSPVTLTPEAALIAKIITKVLFVVRSTSSHRNYFCDSIEQLTRHKAEIAGLVVNGVETRAQGYMYGQNIVQVD
ncbi:GumC family protein [Calothrix sp. CCY 0018]|uniref:GumC family protein n=1 Tax=Calothrix sp. CCY 0018 TaxID=3103864 RepID=UPI0039C5F6E8